MRRLTVVGRRLLRRSKPRLRWRRVDWNRLLLVSVSCLGFLYQVLEVSIHYFHYKTSNRIAINSDGNVSAFSLAVCIRYKELIDAERLLHETGIRMPQEIETEAVEEAASLLTVKQIFAYTPPVNQTIAGCIYRTSDGKVVSTLEQNVCYSVFRVRKYFTQDSICYAFRQKKMVSLDKDIVSHSLHLPFIVGEITFAGQFNRSAYMTAIATGSDLPHRSRDYAERFNCDTKSPCDLRVAPQRFKRRLLPSPYETRCVKEQSSRRIADCMVACTMAALAPINRVTYRLMLEREIDRKPISTRDFSNQTVLSLTAVTYESCKRRCFFPPCDVTITVSHLKQVWRFRTYFAPRVVLLSPRMPDIVATSVAVTSFIEYFSLVCGCFGTWFGLSFLSLTFFFKRRAEGREGKRIPLPTFRSTVVNIVHLFPVPQARVVGRR